jgi:hypothetical protein
MATFFAALDYQPCWRAWSGGARTLLPPRRRCRCGQQILACEGAPRMREDVA